MAENLEAGVRSIASYPLSPLQAGMLAQKAGPAGINITQVLCSLRGQIDSRHMQSAWQRVVDRHDALRTSFYWDADGEGRQQVHPAADLPFTWAGSVHGTDELVRRERQAGFNLQNPPLMRVALAQLGERDFRLLWTFHHLIIDGRSIGLVLKEVFTVYEELCRGETAELPSAPAYRKFIDWLQELDQTGAETFWRKQLKAFSHPTPLPATTIGTPGETREQELKLEPSVVTQLRAFAQENQVTLNTLVQGAWALLLSRYTGEEDIVFGALRAGRRGTVPEAETTAGVFINTVPVRVRISPEQRLGSWLKELRESWVALRRYEHTALAKIQLWSEVPRGQSLFETVINVQDPSWDAALKASGGAWDNRQFRIINDPGFALALDVYADQAMVLKLVYDSGRFDRELVSRMLGHLAALLTGMAANSEQCLSNVSLLTREETKQLADWNNTAAVIPTVPVHQLFERQAARDPRAWAVITPATRLTYEELNQSANALALQLREHGVCPDTRVAVMADRSAELLISVIAVLKCGAAYVPMDPTYPTERLSHMIAETAAPVVLVGKKDAHRVPRIDARLIEVDAGTPLSDTREFRSIASGPLNLAYVIYTSGSTGTPKGVEIQHRGLSNLVEWHQKTYAITSADRATQIASPSFDAAVWEIWPYLTRGAAIYIPDEETRVSSSKLVAWLALHEITFCFMPTPLAEQALEENWPANSRLKVLLTGGDKLRKRPRLRMPFRLVNHYGPTENSVVTTCAEVTTDSAPTIGKPIANTKVYVLDRYLRPAPIGIAGELYISGDGLARGYLQQPELTAERFLSNPFEPGSRLYRTGDLVRQLPDGNLDFVGRVDHQVKVRGYRIETGEVEICLNRHPVVRQCAVVSREERGETRLIAYLVGRNAPRVPVPELRRHVGQSLPSYMIPSVFVWMERLPLTSNGKVDRAALPAPEEEIEVMLPASSSAELVVAGIWKELLRKEQIGRNANFFELGGHSLMAARVISRLEAVFGVELSLREFFSVPTVAGVAEWIETHRQDRPERARGRIPTRAEKGAVLSFAQERLWFMERLQPGLAFNNIPLGIRIGGDLNVQALQQAIHLIVDRHDSLRTTFRNSKGRPVAEIAAAANLAIEPIDLGSMTPAEREAEVTRISHEEARQPFNLEQAPLLRIKLVRLEKTQHFLLITTHHIVSDGWSLGVFYHDLAALYDAICRGESNPLQALPISYSDFAAWQRDALSGPRLDEQLGYWQAELKEAGTTLELPTDHPRPAVQSYKGATHFFALPNSLATNLQALAQRERVTLFMLLLSAFQSLMKRYSGQEEVMVGSPVAGRTRVESEGMIGLFLNNLAFRAKFPSELTFRELLMRNRETALGAYAHQDLPFEKLVDTLHLQRDLSRSPLFQVMFVLQNTPLQPLNLTGLSLTPIPLHSGTSKYDLTLGIEERPNGLAGYVEYSTDLFTEGTILRMLGHFETLLEGVVQNPDERISRLPLLTPAEKRQLLVEWNDTRSEYPNLCIHQLFEAQVEKTPQSIALAFEEQELSYQEVNERANRLAHRLRALGAGPEVRVAICLKRSLEMVIALLAIHKAGGAYVPLDPNYPVERLEFMLEDSGAAILITQQILSGKLSFPAEQTVLVDSFFRDSTESSENPQSGATPENAAYVIYTSGSTGQPKGVVVLHRNAVNFFTGMDQRIGTSPGVWLAVTSISFDISVLELFWTLTRGFKVVIQSDESSFRAPAAPASAAAPRTRQKMDFSLFYFASDGGGGRDQYRLLIEGAKFADANGLSAVWTPERHFHQFGGLYPNPSVTSAAIAMVTNRVQLRAGSVVMPLHHPVRVAEEWSVVDNLSNGRAAISFASGWHANDFVFAPANYVSRRQLMYRDIDLFRKLWRGETVLLPGGSGENVKVRIFPQPVQKELPAWLTSSGDPETFRMSGELGLNVLTHLSGQSVEQLAEKIGIYRKAWQQSGRTGRGHVSLMLHTFVWPDMDAAWKKVRKPLWDYLKTYRDLSAGSKAPKPAGDVEAMLNDAVSRYFAMTGMFGPQEHCCKTVDQMRELGVDEIACLLDFGVETEAVIESLQHLKAVQDRCNRSVFTGVSSYSIAEQLQRHGVTHFQCTPALLTMLVEDAETLAALRKVETIMLGGEAFPVPLAQRLEGKARILNMYGPTETTIWSTTHEVKESAGSIPIGRPIANTEIYIVDGEQQPVPVNVPGELLIGGAGVARGYLNRPELTAARFIANPFSADPGARLYRTGDLARYLPNGEIECLGRTDHQVKLRGFRIELGEIEAALRLHPAIREAAVVVREVAPNDKRLIGYATAKEKEHPAAPELKRFLKEKLPDYMVPSLFVFLEKLPLTPNGKIDRKALPNPEPKRAEAETSFVAAQSELEKSLGRIWEQLLQLERVGTNDNFFDLGGHSLLAAQLQARISETLRVDLPIIRLFQYPTVSSLAKFLSQGQKEGTSLRKVQDRARRQREAFAWRNQATQNAAI